MYARVMTIGIGPEGIEASIRYFEEVVIPRVRDLPGFKGATLLVNRDDHLVRSLTYWATPGQLEASAGTAGQLRQGLTDRIEGAETVSVEVFEVAIDVTGDAG
jgi:hypothetical protein